MAINVIISVALWPICAFTLTNIFNTADARLLGTTPRVCGSELVKAVDSSVLEKEIQLACAAAECKSFKT